MAAGDVRKARLEEPPPEKEEEQDEGAPAWMVTMGDMNTLLMTFFIVLYSMLVVQRNQYKKLSTTDKSMALLDTEAAEAILEAEPNESEVLSGREPGSGDRTAEREEVLDFGERQGAHGARLPGGGRRRFANVADHQLVFHRLPEGAM